MSPMESKRPYRISMAPTGSEHPLQDHGASHRIRTSFTGSGHLPQGWSVLYRVRAFATGSEHPQQGQYGSHRVQSIPYRVKVKASPKGSGHLPRGRMSSTGSGCLSGSGHPIKDHGNLPQGGHVLYRIRAPPTGSEQPLNGQGNSHGMGLLPTGSGHLPQGRSAPYRSWVSVSP